MKRAKYYLYRNLHTNSFSITFKQKVIDHPKTCIMFDAEFIVSENGRQRVFKDKRKNVHARVSGSHYELLKDVLSIDGYEQVFYNPYNNQSFVDHSGSKVLFADHVLCINNKIYISENS